MIKKFLDFIKGFFTSDSSNSSKRLVGIIGALNFFYTFHVNSKTEAHFGTSDTFIWANVVIVSVALGLTSVETIGNIVAKIKNNPEPTQN
jgi:hypothetical protein